MKRYLKILALVGVLAVVGAACQGAGDQGPGEQGEDVEKGGTLRLSLESDVSAAFDPQKEYYSITWEFYRCCLLRTLLSYNGKSTEEGGTELFPDLATEEPEVSEDGTVYTFTLKDGITYAPPFQDTEIVAQDFIRAMEREADPKASSGGYSFYYSIIEGFDDFSAGDADTISGMTAVDDKTLEVTLTEPAGDFPFRMAMPAAAPIPEGAADGHVKDYGRFLVASGPYMFEGSEDITADQPAAGYEPGESIVLVRNPSWSNDDLRPANVDRIEVSIGGTSEDHALQVDSGELDWSQDGVPPPDQLRRYQTSPDLQGRVFVFPSDAVRYLSFNIAEPPFDDIAVRKAVNFAIDKDSMRRARGGPAAGELAGHIMVNSLQNNLIEDYDPYPSPNGQGDAAAAQEEMKNAQYDENGDGSCDEAPECKDVLAVTDEADPYPQQAALIQTALEPLGITLDVKSFERTTMYDKCNDPGAHVAFCLAPGWGKDYLDGTTFGEPLFGSVSIGPDACCNYSLVGAPAELLRQHDYEVTDVPSVDDKIDECDPLTEDERFQCWAELDQQLMEEVVPWVPYLFDNNIDIVSARVRNYTFDQFAGLAALDHVSLAGGGAES